MVKEQISVKQGIFIIALFIIGNSLVLPTAVEAKQDLWLSIMIGLVMVLPIFAIIVRLHKLFPGKDLFQMLEVIFGKIVGKILSLCFIWFALSLGAVVLRNYGEFIVILDLSETPKTLPMVLLLALCIWGARAGQEVIGRWSVPFAVMTIFMVFLTLLFLIPESRISNLQPILYRGFAPVLKGAWSVFAFPLAEIIIVSMVFAHFEENKPLKIYGLGLLIGWIVVFFAALSEVSILGGELYSRAYFPSNMSVARLNVADFLQRLEIIPAVTLLVGGFVKISICLMAAARGITGLINAKNYRFIVVPTALALLNVAEWLIKNPFQMFEGIVLWPYYAFPFEVVLPLIIWIGAEIRNHFQSKKERCEG